MPISTNAPFNEFGQSQILRDIEQLYLALNGAGSGGAGDGQTQDQSEATSQDSGGLPDLSGLATIDYVDAAIGSIPSISYPISIADGGTSATTASGALTALGIPERNFISYAGGTYSIPAGVTRVTFYLIGGGGGGCNYDIVTYGAVNIDVSGGGGGAGGTMIASVDVVPSESFTVTIGSGGSAGSSSGASGGATSVALPGSFTITAAGGSGAAEQRGGRGGLGGSMPSSGRTAVGRSMVGANGSSGGIINPSDTNAPNPGGGGWVAVSGGAAEYGSGGNGAGYSASATAGSSGRVLMVY